MIPKDLSEQQEHDVDQKAIKLNINNLVLLKIN